MTQRSTPQRKADEAAFPIRLKFIVPVGGLGNMLVDMHDWLRSNIGSARHAVHSGRSVTMASIAIYFVDMAEAVRFTEAFPALELADGTLCSTYSSPAKAHQKGRQRMDAKQLLAAARELADRLQRSLDNPATEHVILRREEAVLAKGLIDGACEVLEKEVGGGETTQ